MARTVGVRESTVRYHLRRAAEGTEDGRWAKPFEAQAYAEVIAAWHRERGARSVRSTVRELYEHLVAEHGYAHSYCSVLPLVRAKCPRQHKKGDRR
jgi:hypothetical protein